MTDVTPANLDPAAPSSKEETPKIESAKAGTVRAEVPRPAPRPAEQRAPRGGFLSGLIGGVIGGAALVAALYVTLGPKYLGNGADLAGLDAKVAALTRQTEALGAAQQSQSQQIDQRLAAAGNGAASNEATGAKVEALATGLAALHETLTNLQQNMPPQGLGDRVASLSATIGNLQPQVERLQTDLAAVTAKVTEPTAARRAALTLAIGTLTRATETAAPFRTELAAVASGLPDEPLVQGLKPLAETGVPTLPMLTLRFPAATDQIVAAVNAAQDQGFWSRLWRRARNLVTIRRTGPIEGASTEAVLSRMEAALAAADLQGAVTAAADLKGTAAGAAKPWLDQAQARLLTDATVQKLNALAAEQLANPKG
ncbi:MAG: mitofilin family membrane protein [Parvibaculaceae bacterium]|nr:mitofilin family membrane protein [Parvibaculaceae bacterium]